MASPPPYLRLNSDHSVEKREQVIRQALKEHPEDKHQLEMWLVHTWFPSPPHHEQCIALCDKLIVECKDEEVLSWTWYLSAILIEEDRKDKDEAEKRYKKALQYDPDIGQCFEALCEISMEKRQWEEAMDWARKMEQHEDFQYNGIICHGNVWFAQRNFSKALEHYQRLEKLQPDYAGNLYNIGACLHEMQQTDKAQPYFERALQLEPEDADSMYGMGNCYQARGDRWRAMHWYTEALKRKPNFPEVFNNMGKLQLEHESDYKETVKLLEKAVEVAPEKLSPKMALIYQNLMKLHKQMLNHEEAEQYKMKWYECHGLLDLYWLAKDNDDDNPEDEPAD